MPDPSSVDTAPPGDFPPVDFDDPNGRQVARKRRGLYRVATGVLIFVMCLAVVDSRWGLLHDPGSRAEATGNGYRLSVQYPGVIRPGLEGRIRIHLQAEGGFDESEVDLGLDHSWMTAWDINQVIPQPSQETMPPGMVVWTFDTPTDSSELMVELQVAFSLSGLRGRSGRVAVLDDNGAEALGVDLKTRIWP